MSGISVKVESLAKRLGERGAIPISERSGATAERAALVVSA
jgi:hypothetical protein